MTDKHSAYRDTEDRVVTFLERGDIAQFYVRILRFCRGCNTQIKQEEQDAMAVQNHGDRRGVAVGIPVGVGNSNCGDTAVLDRCPPCAALWAEDEALLDEMAGCERRYRDSDAWERDIEEHEGGK